jgi:pSer/pThr/pTyr-binding forkhead associated (FHA) protein
VPAEPSATMIYPRDTDAEPEQPPEPEQEPAVLKVEGREIPLTSERIVLGRSRECDVRLTDANVSRRHAEVRHEDDEFWIVDLGSTNGTELNGKRIERARLADGDTITLGATEVGFSRPQP